MTALMIELILRIAKDRTRQILQTRYPVEVKALAILELGVDTQKAIAKALLENI